VLNEANLGLVYKLEADGAAILTVLHGARRWPR
jgi:hypothetical protein